MKKTLKYLLGALSDKLDEYDYYQMLGSLKEANLSIDELKKKLQRLVAEAESADRSYGAGNVLVNYWAEVNSCLPDDDYLTYEYNDAMDKAKEELGLEAVDVDDDDWDSLEEYFDNIEIEESKLDILHDRLETAVKEEHTVKRLLDGFEKIEDLKIREEKMEGCVTVLEEAKQKHDSVVSEADYAFHQVTWDIEKKLNEYVQQNIENKNK